MNFVYEGELIFSEEFAVGKCVMGKEFCGRTGPLEVGNVNIQKDYLCYNKQSYPVEVVKGLSFNICQYEFISSYKLLNFIKHSFSG